MAFQILFLDIDGTILKPDHTYTKSTKEAIRQVKEQGIEVFFATGRPSHEITDLANELGVHSIIGYNGAYAIHQDKMIINEPMKGNTIQQYRVIAKQLNNELVFYTNTDSYFTALDTKEVKQFIQTFQAVNNHVDCPEITEQVLGCTIINANSEQVTQYEVNPDIHLTQVNIDGVRHCYDVIRTSVNKGMAIKQVLKQLAITPNQAIAFGDGMNDREMMQVVEHGFAMGNANPNLLPYARYQTTTVTNDGIFNGLKQLGLVK